NFIILAKKYEAAIDKYSEAINLNPTVAAYYANRSFAYFKTEAFGYAVADADKAIKLDPSYTKVKIFLLVLKICNYTFEKKSY
ncbi:hypothetical protein C1646_622781, partial [Rhizophagus diaphanus]